MSLHPAPVNWLYPLNPRSTTRYVFRDTHGTEWPTSYEGFKASGELTKGSEWSLVNGFNLIGPGALVWAYFSQPDGHIRAVGRLRSWPKWKKEWEHNAIWIDWDQSLTKRLISNPIPFGDFKQKVQSAANRANPKTQRVLETWLAGNQSKAERERDEVVRFRTQQVEARLGQQEFRNALMRAYGNRCAITGCEVDTTLEAAHIAAVAEGGRHAVSNGLLLRADLHNLLDCGLITFSDNFKVIVHGSIRHSEYGKLQGKPLRAPSPLSLRPKLTALRQHRKLFGH